jgi:glycosyltransferase involved in cell wall biosynthesis
MSESRIKTLVVPSWYPSDSNPTSGAFIREQVRALAPVADMAVIHVGQGEGPGQEVTFEGGVTVVRVTVPQGRLATLRSLPSAGLAALEALSHESGLPDIVHVQALWPAGLIARAINRRYGIPYVVTEHSEEYSIASERRLVKTPGMVPLVLRPLARSASRTIAVSHHLMSRLVELGLAKDPVVIPNVVLVSKPEPLPPDEPHVITHVSIMSPAKNLDALLRSAETLRQRRSDFRLRLVGDGEMRKSLEALSSSLSLDEIVEFTGMKPAAEVRALVAQSAFTVVSSTHETFSVTAAESLMCGRPVLSTRCGGPEEFITAEVGRLIGAGSVDALVKGLDWMLDHYTDFDPQALHDYAKARFAPEVVAVQILQVYRGVLGV